MSLLLIINPVLFRSVAEGQLCLSTALAVNLLDLFRICAAVAHAVALLRRVLLSRAAPFSVLTEIAALFSALSFLLFRSVAEEELS